MLHEALERRPHQNLVGAPGLEDEIGGLLRLTGSAGALEPGGEDRPFRARSFAHGFDRAVARRAHIGLCLKDDDRLLVLAVRFARSPCSLEGFWNRIVP